MKIDKTDFDKLSKDFPHIIDEMRIRIRSYKDPKMIQKLKYLANIPWLRFVNESVIKAVLEEVDIIRMSE